MEEKKNRFYVTTSIAYANSVPHIGFAMEALQADVLARYHELKGDEVFFCSGTDEHGSKIKRTATEKGLEPQAFVDGNAARFKELLKALNVSNDIFIRTTDEKHKIAAQKLWMKLYEAGDIYDKTYKGKYCVGCEAFLTEKDLVDGKCPYHQKEPEEVDEKNYFFKVSRYLPGIKEKIKSGEIEVIPEARKNEILNIIEDAEKEKMDVSFSRSKNVLDWGVPVPNDSEQTMYVWCDALTNYISALGYGECEDSLLERGKGCVNFEKFWLDNKNITHVIGKDILRFHAMVWPAMLLSAGLPLPKKICVHSFITSGGQKMSKSLGNVIDPFEVIEKYGVDPMRYYLLKEIPTTEDGDFSYERFEEVYKSDLQNGLGNLVARVLAMTEKYFEGKVPEVDLEKTGLAEEIGETLFNSSMEENQWIFKSVDNKLEEFRLDKTLGLIISFGDTNNPDLKGGLVSKLDRYITATEPYKLIKTAQKETAIIIYNLLENLRQIAWMIRPFMPETSDKIFEQLFVNEVDRKVELAKNFEEIQKWGGLKPGTCVQKGESLFPRLEK
ncbi:MAG: methionine--tRNA ligase [Candidatus Paceibacterota bacterium]